ncbi:RsmB/NOP family class I SAM-dependent RNA methyltransferase [Rhizobium sp. C1]|uniref:RsmB/NOP family class I SAM-dependent RNA methyltransferase n=1 Tax=Rhizobium sp. C1 TaxID=1349799 RepID=UPI003FA7180E
MTSKPVRPKPGSASRGAIKTSDKPGLAARQAASRLLAAVIDKKASLDGMLDQTGGNPAYMALSPADRGLVRAILNTALRHLPRIEAMIGSLLKTPLPDGARALQHVLMVAAAQILYLDVPDRAAVDLAVEQANDDPRNKRFASLVNALLRRLSSEKERLLNEVGAPVPALPDWFQSRLVAVYGPEAALAIAEAHLAPAAIDLTVKSDPEGWAQRLGGVVLPTGSVRLADYEGSVVDLEGYADGEWWVQDAAAAIPARLFGNLQDKRVVDLCAAPGGKTAQLIQAGAKVTALDMSANRLKRLKENLDRLRFEAELIEGNAGDHKPAALYDAALLDAPCSSTGTARRHPDVPWTKGLDDVRKLAGVQERLLRHALSLVKPGGIVVFSNCSLDPIEGEEMIGRLLASMPSVTRVPVTASVLPGLPDAITAKGEVRTTPAMLERETAAASGMDGFYACVLRRDS